MFPLPPNSTLRFEDKSNATVGGRGYDIYLGEEILYSCDVEGQCIKKPTEFFQPGADEPSFTLRAKRKVLNFTYYLDAGRAGARLGTLDCKKTGALWTIMDDEEETIAKIVDPTKVAVSLARTALGGSADGYLLSFGDESRARIERMKRPQKNPATGRVGKFFQKLLTLWDWGLLVDRELSGRDGALSIAATLLLIEHQIRNSRSL